MQTAVPAPKVRQPLSALSRVAALALLGLSVSYGVLFLGIAREFAPVALTIPIFALLALLVASGWRWAPLVAAVLSTLLLLPELPLLLGHLQDPLPGFLINVVFNPVLFAVAIISAFAAAVQNFREVRATPSGLAPGLALAGGLMLAGVAFALVTPRGTASGLTPEVVASLPLVKTKNFTFEPKVIHAKVGDTVALRLENEDAGAAHRFDIDELGVHVPMFHGDSRPAVFRVTKAGSYTYYCDLPGHRHMRGTLIVTE